MGGSIESDHGDECKIGSLYIRIICSGTTGEVQLGRKRSSVVIGAVGDSCHSTDSSFPEHLKPTSVT